MNQSKARSTFISPLLLSFLTSILSVVFIIFIAHFGAFLLSLPQNLLSREIIDGEPYASLIGGTFIAIMCYIICKKHPKSYWFVPIVANIFGIWTVIANYNSPELDSFIISHGTGWFLSLAGAIRGSVKGSQSIT